MEFSAKTLEQYQQILMKYPEKRAALIPVLWLGVHEFGYISREAADYIANLMGLSAAQVYSVASFYTMIYKKPVGKYHIQVCKTLSCWMMGAPEIVAHLRNSLGIKVGETTPDDKFTLSCVECLGSCGTAPMMQVNVNYHENLTTAKVDELLEQWRKD